MLKEICASRSLFVIHTELISTVCTLQCAKQGSRVLSKAKMFIPAIKTLDKASNIASISSPLSHILSSAIIMGALQHIHCGCRCSLHCNLVTPLKLVYSCLLLEGI